MRIGGSLLWVKRPGLEANHSLPSVPRFTTRGVIPSFCLTSSWCGV